MHGKNIDQNINYVYVLIFQTFGIFIFKILFLILKFPKNFENPIHGKNIDQNINLDSHIYFPNFFWIFLFLKFYF